MIKLISYLPYGTAVFFALLFCYTAGSKMLDFANFQVQLAQSPLLSAYAGLVSYAVIIGELIIAGLLCFKITRLWGLYASFGLMLAFTFYIWLILDYSDFIPCSCGGILEKLDWTEHLVFNVVCLLLALAASIINGKERAHGWSRTAAIGALTVFPVVSVVALFLSSEHMLTKENGFKRTFLENPYTEKAVYLPFEGYYFAGVDKERIYLGNSSRPFIVTSFTPDLKEMKTLKIEPENWSAFLFRNLQVQVYSDHFYLFDGTVPVIYRGNLSHPQAKVISKNDAFFTQFAVLDSMSFALRSQSSSSHQYVIASLLLRPVPHVIIHDQLLEKQIDGVFDVDGLLKAGQSHAVYTYSYRNEFIVMDSQLRRLAKMNTIDSTSKARISVTALQDGTRRMNAPPVKVNENLALYRTLLFIQSNMRGKNEKYREWRKHATVDVYRTDAHQYLGSFRIERRRAKPMQDFLITGQHLYTVRGNELKMYGYSKNLKNIIEQGEAENLTKE